MAPKFNYIRRLSETALQNIQLLNSVRRTQNDLIINGRTSGRKSNLKSFSLNRQKSNVDVFDLKNEFL